MTEFNEVEDTLSGGEYAAVFGELLMTGWDWGREDWTSWTMKPETLELVRPRINQKIEERYYMRELNIELPGRWKLMMKSKMNEIMDEIGPQYEELAHGIDLSGISYTRHRNIDSEFPQSMLMPETEDYASSGNEGGSESFSSSTTLDAIMKFRAAAIAPDNEALRKVDVMFSHTPYFL